MRPCWCGNREFHAFSTEYGTCRVCGTLVSLASLSNEELQVHDDEVDFYGKRYWLKHQKKELGFPDIHARARNDLTERNLHWLKILLKYARQPAAIMELGCGHGSFVALMRRAGFDAWGVELSPWVVHFANEAFGVRVLVGPIEDLAIEKGTLDAIVLMDVLEHLADPLATMRQCLDLLKPDGLLLIQTPQFDEQMRYAEVVASGDPFLTVLVPDEHLYMFSRRAITELFARLGVQHLYFEPALFAMYDMCIVVGKTELQTRTDDAIESALRSSPDGRMVQALLDLRERELAVSARLALIDADRGARGVQVDTLTGLLRESEADRGARAEQIRLLDSLLKESETDRASRGEQIGTLESLLKESEADRAARGEQIRVLDSLLKESEGDRAARGDQIRILDSLLKESEADRHARGVQLSALGSATVRLDVDRTDSANSVADLAARLHASDVDRASRGEQITVLTRLLKESEADRAARFEQIEALTMQLKASEIDRADRARQIDILTDLAKRAQAALAALEARSAMTGPAAQETAGTSRSSR